MKKRLVCLAAAIIAAFGIASCAKEPEVPAVQVEDGSKLVIGFSMATLLEDRWIRDRDIFTAKAQQEGIEVIVTNANMDSAIQYEQVKKMLEQGIDVLVIAPSDSYEETKCVVAAKQNGVPVISYDRLVYNAGVDAYVSFDNNEIGVLMAETLMESVPTGGYVVINGAPNDNNSSSIDAGIMSVLDAPIAAGEIELLDKTWVDDWVREGAYEFMANAIENYGGEINAVAVGNDSMAWGVIDALSEAQMAGKVRVVGQDADLVACRRVVQGQQLMTVYKPIKALVESTVELCVRLAAGQDVDTEQTMYDGSYDVPYVAIEVAAVTKDHMDETVVKDKFHLKEEIYRQPEEGARQE